MTFSSPSIGRLTRVISLVAAATVLSALLSSRAISAPPSAPDSILPPTAAAPAPVSPPSAPQDSQTAQPSAAAQPTPSEAKARESWRKSMSRTPTPKKGCFTATYPDTTWQEVACTTAPPRPYLPARGPRPDTVGNGTDFSAQVTSGVISSADGSFVRVIGVTSESDDGSANTFSLQLNSSFFTTSVCNGAATPSSCLGWQQFVYTNSGAAFMQYWLLDYGTCPGGWNQYGSDCYKNSSAVSVPVQTIANLAELVLTGTVVSGGTDTVALSTGSALYSAQGEDSVLNLAQGWQVAEFNIIGDGNASEANFNTGSTLVVKTSVENGTSNAPSCVEEGFTGETNNLTLVTSPAVCCPIGGSSPAIVFTESNATGAISTCSSPALVPILNLLLQ